MSGDEILDYIAGCEVRQPYRSSVTLEMESAFEVEALIELASETLKTAESDFNEAIRTQRSSDALAHALQVKNLRALEEKLRETARDFRRR